MVTELPLLLTFMASADRRLAAISKLLRVRVLASKKRLITVFGCGGSRDKTKRPLMGEVAGKLSDLVIVTSDNPREEIPKSIIDDIIPGLEKTSSLFKIEEDREKAIQKALEEAEEEDIVLIAGKGHEEFQEIAGQKIRFSDKEVVKNYLGK